MTTRDAITTNYIDLVSHEGLCGLTLVQSGNAEKNISTTTDSGQCKHAGGFMGGNEVVAEEC